MYYNFIINLPFSCTSQFVPLLKHTGYNKRIGSWLAFKTISLHLCKTTRLSLGSWQHTSRFHIMLWEYGYKYTRILI